MKTNTRQPQQGFIIASLLVLIMVVSVLLLTINSTAIANFQSSRLENSRVNAQFAADSGLDQGIYELNMDSEWTGTADEAELFNDGAIRTTYEIIVSDSTDENRKVIRSIGRTYEPASNTEPKATRIFELEAEAVTTGVGPGSVVSGVGGLILRNNARITGGDVIVNGTVTLNNNAQIGLSTNPVNLRVAHQSCPTPPNASYPQVCTSGNPISNGGIIYADVQAQNQTNGSNMFSPGLTSSSFDPIPVPGYDRPAHKAAVSVSYPPNNANVSCGNNQTKTWPANVRITGNVSLGNGCTVTLSGDVWIEGSLSFGNNSRIVISDIVGAVRPNVMIDSQSGFVTGNNTQIIPNSVGTGAEFITMWWNTNTSTNGGFTCGGIPDPFDCTNVTGLALSTSQNVITIDLDNNTNAANSVFRTLWSRAEIANNGALGAVAGQTIELRQNAVINFSASIDGSDNLIVTWVKRGYLRVFQ